MSDSQHPRTFRANRPSAARTSGALVCDTRGRRPRTERTSAVAALDSPETDAQGVDLTLVRYSLGLTPTERLEALEGFMNALADVKVVRRANDTKR